MKALRSLVGMLAVLLGVFWAAAGLYKAADLVGLAPPGTAQAAPEYPVALLWCVCVVEIAAALAIFSGKTTLGLALGAWMLVVFCVVLVIYPPRAGGCGCFGAHAGNLFGVEPGARNIGLLGLHTLLLVSGWTRKQTMRGGTPAVA